MKKWLYRFWFLGFAFFLCSPLAYAKKEPLKITADRMIYQKDRLILVGNVTLSTKDILIRGIKAVFYKSTKIGEIKGNVSLVHKNMRITGDTLKIYYKKGMAVLQGGIRAEYQGHGIPKTIIKGQKILYLWNEKKVIASKGVEIIQGEKRAFANKGFFDGVYNTVTLTGNVKIEQSSGNWLSCGKATLNLNNNTITASEGVKGNLWINIKQGKGHLISTYPDKISPITIPMDDSVF